ncbi:MAG: hypothetical protein K8I00_10675, partial [Candidatus Omnitrophica bacterium]|nr:hypothetical protein [Candidatus Omnitrophota bacterium]
MLLPRQVIPLVCVFVCVQSGPVSAVSRNAWKKIEVGLDADRACCLYVFPEPDGGTIVAADKSVYYDKNQGRFHRLFSFTHAEDLINDVWGDLSRGRVLVATGRGLYHAPLGGGPAERIFSAADERQRKCRTVMMQREAIYLGTERGAYVRRDEKDLWRKLPRLGDSPVYQIAEAKEWIYFVSDREVLAFHAGGEWQQVYSRGVTATDGDAESEVSRAAARLAVRH